MLESGTKSGLVDAQEWIAGALTRHRTWHARQAARAKVGNLGQPMVALRIFRFSRDREPSVGLRVLVAAANLDVTWQGGKPVE